MTNNQLTTAIEKVYNRNLNKVAEIIIKNLGRNLNDAIGKPTKLADSFYHEIINNEIKIFSSSNVPMFLEKGTKPHIIRPKKAGGALVFKALESGVRKNGTRYMMGDEIVVREVKHPGFETRPFIQGALFTSKPEILSVMAKSPNRPPLHFFIDGKQIKLL